MRRILIGTGIALVSVSVSISAQEQAPCAAPLSPKITPCGKPGAVSPKTAVVATLDGAPITVADLDQETRKKVEGLDAAVAEARKKARREATDDALLAREAARRGVTVGRLLELEVLRNVARPTDAEVAAEMASKPEHYTRPKEQSEWAAGILYDRRWQRREKELVAEIEKRGPAKNVDAASRMGIAATDATIQVLAAEKDAVAAAIHDRLLRAAAKREEITPEQLTAREVTAKVVPPTEEELKAAWEKYHALLGDDLEAAREDLRQYLAGEKKAAAEKAFDARLRAGHDVRMLVEVPSPPRLDVAAAGAPFSGPRDAKVTLVEFGDFECPPCGVMSHVIDQVLPAYETSVRYVFRQFPLSMHPFAWKAAEAALAAHAQGKFFPYAHLLFAHQKELDVASLRRYATEAGLDRKRFDDDLDSGRFAREVIESRRAGLRAGIPGTPAFYLNGVALGEEALTPDGMRAALDAALQRK